MLMATDFRATTDAFVQSLDTIGEFVSALDSPQSTDSPRPKPRVRVAVVNSAMLLIAATFEEFVREMANLSARHAVKASHALSDLPTSLLRTAWQRTFGSIASAVIPQSTDSQGIMSAVTEAEGRTTTLLAFLRGDFTQEIYDGLVHNDGAMRIRQINSLFRISDIKDVCKLTSQSQCIIDHFNSDSADQASSDLNNFIDQFIEQRNDIAHRLNSAISLAPKDVHEHIGTFHVFANSLCDTLEREHGI